MTKTVNRTFRVREGFALEADMEKREVVEVPFVILDDEPLPEHAAVKSDKLVYASMPVHDFFKAAVIRDKSK